MGVATGRRIWILWSLWSDYYNSQDSEKYRSHIVKEGERISFGLNPSAGFEDAYFKAGNMENKASGQILLDIQPVNGLEISGTFTDEKDIVALGINGTVTNKTNWDFEYFAVIAYDTLFIYNNLPAGETCGLNKAVYLSSKNYDDVVEDYLHGYMNAAYRGKNERCRFYRCAWNWSCGCKFTGRSRCQNCGWRDKGLE